MINVYALNLETIVEEIIDTCSDVSRTRSGKPRKGESEDYIRGKKDAIIEAMGLLEYFMGKAEISPEVIKDCLNDKNALVEWKEAWS